MATVATIFQTLDQWAPFETQMEFDTAGFLVGRGDREVQKILIALDITESVVDEAAAWGANLIVSHHPLIFHPIKRLTDETPTGRTLLALAEHSIAAICAHTNLDAAQGGVNVCLAQALELTDLEQLHLDGTDQNGQPYGIGRVGTCVNTGLSAADYAAFVKEKLRAAGVRFVDGGRPVWRVAVGGGSCGSMLSDALAAGCDTFVTADVKYDQFLEAKALGLTLLDAGHYATEQVVCPKMVQYLSLKFPGIPIKLSQTHSEVYSCV